jgi:hypothetical protein
MFFIREMIETSNDEEIEFLGIGLFGDNGILKSEHSLQKVGELLA